MVSRCFPGGYNVKLYISRGRLAWWLLAFLHSVNICTWSAHKWVRLTYYRPGYPVKVDSTFLITTVFAFIFYCYEAMLTLAEKRNNWLRSTTAVPHEEVQQYNMNKYMIINSFYSTRYRCDRISSCDNPLLLELQFLIAIYLNIFYVISHQKGLDRPQMQCYSLLLYCCCTAIAQE